MSLKAVAAHNAQASLNRKNTVVLEGHSFVSNNSTADSSWGLPGMAPVGNGYTYSKGVFMRAMIRMNQPFTVLTNQGVGGNTSTNILARIPNDLAYNPGWLFLDPFTNDALDSVPLATTIANVTSMLTQAAAQDVMVILALDGPRTGLTQSQITLAVKVSDYFKDYAIDNPGVIIFDQAPYRWDLTSLASSEAYSPLASVVLSDGVHPNAYGAGLLGEQGLARVLKPYIAASYRGPAANGNGTSTGDTDNLFANPLMVVGSGGTAGTGASGTVAQNMVAQRSTGAISGACSLVSRATLAATYPGLFDDGTFGNVQQIALSGATAATDTFQYSIYPATGYVTDLTGPWVVEVEIGATATSGTLGQICGNIFIQTNSGYWNGYMNANADSGDYLGSTFFQGKLRSQPFYAPVGVVTPQHAFNIVFNLLLSTSSGGAATVNIANPVWRLVEA
jgi:lysophospholipase L1-like esterase